MAGTRSRWCAPEHTHRDEVYIELFRPCAASECITLTVVPLPHSMDKVGRHHRHGTIKSRPANLMRVLLFLGIAL